MGLFQTRALPLLGETPRHFAPKGALGIPRWAGQGIDPCPAQDLRGRSFAPSSEDDMAIYSLNVATVGKSTH